MEIRVGEVIHYFSHLGVAVVRVKGDIKTGDQFHFLGRTTNFEQVVTSLETRHRAIQRACAGEEIAIKTAGVVRKGDLVFRVVNVEEMGMEAIGL